MFRSTVILFSLGLVVGNGESTEINRIFNGQNADIHDYSYMVTLRSPNGGRDFCGGAIIGERHILTAAHCIIDKSTNFNVHSGTSLVSEQGRVHRVASYRVHPGYNGTQAASWVHDIGVVTLRGPIAFGETQQPAKLPRKDLEERQAVTLTGWGQNTMTSTLSQLQKLETFVILAKYCRAPRNVKLYDTQICAFSRLRTGACFGDSGSPLASDGTVVGITSWVGSSQCGSGKPDVYTNVYSYLDFIRSAMESS